MRIVIGVTGKLGSGKDYITNHVIIPVIEKIKYRYLQCAFADQIKVNVMTKNNISYNDVYENKTPESGNYYRMKVQKLVECRTVIFG